MAVIKKKKKFGIKIPPLVQNLPPFEWTLGHQKSFEKLKHSLITVPVLAYPNYNKQFLLETDASLKGLGTVLSQQDSNGDQQVISFVSRSLKPYEKLMKSYSSAKLELLALKWAVCDKFKDYLLGSKFTVLTDNNPLCYVKTSKLGASQIRWLSDLHLFDFDIKYHVGRKNQVADTLSHHPLNPDSSLESEDDDDNWETISYGMVCQSINHLTDSMKIPFDVKL